MGCGSSHTVSEGINHPLTNGDIIKEQTTETDTEIINIPIKYPPAEAFEIPLEVDPDSLIRKHPPKRIQKLIDERPVTPQNLKALEDKLANAEMRRQQILLQRVSTVIKQRDKDNDDEEIKVPELVTETTTNTEITINTEISKEV